jgi:glycosyltransferase involved in cell wall biosynthesis
MKNHLQLGKFDGSLFGYPARLHQPLLSTMRILFIVHQYAPRWIGGTEVLVQRLAKQLLTTGHQPVVVTYEESPSNRVADFGIRSTEVDRVPVHEIHYNLSCDPVPSLAEYDNAMTAQWLGQVIDVADPDVAHVAHGMKMSGAVFPVLRRHGIPIVTTLSDFWFICMRHTLLRPGNVLCDGPDHRYRCLRCAGATHGFAAPLATRYPEPWLWWIAALREALSFAGIGRRSKVTRDIHNVAQRAERLRDLLLNSDHRVFRFPKGHVCPQRLSERADCGHPP